MNTLLPPALAARHFELPARLGRTLWALLAAGAALTAAGLLLSGWEAPGPEAAAWTVELYAWLDPTRAWPNYLLAAVYLAGLGLGGALFLALTGVTSAGWAVAFRRVPEALTALLPAALLLLVGLGLGLHHLYEWSREEAAADPVLSGKAGWLNAGAFLARTVVCAGLWIVLARALAGRRGSPGRSALFLVLFAVTFTVASVDWLMSLQPHWYSTIFGVYCFAGALESGLAAITIGVILLRRAGPLSGVVSDEHLHDLGKLMFGFATFWAYIWFSQYMLIWYSNLPEETAFFMARHSGGWGPLAVASLCLNWVIPFLVLLPRPAKRNETILLTISTVLLVGHWLDLYTLILPPFTGGSPLFGLWELGAMLLVAALGGLLAARALRRGPLVPVGDPFLAESLYHHQ